METLRTAYMVFANKHPDFIAQLDQVRAQSAWDLLAMHRASFNTALFDLGVALRTHPILDGSGTIMVNAASGGAFGFGSEGLAMVFAEYAGRSSFDDAIDWLDRIVETPTAPANLLVAIRGLRLNSEVKIGAWLFVPREEARDRFDIDLHLISIDKETIGGACHAIAVSPLGDVPWRSGMSTAESQQANQTCQGLIDQLRVINNAIAYTDGGAPSVDRWWTVYAGDTFRPFLQPPTTVRDIQPRHPFKITDLSNAGAAAAARHLEFKGSFKKQMDIAARRLASARRRVGDQADTLIDLAIAIESLLGDSERSDFTYKLSLRGGLLLGDDLDSRKRIHGTIRELYKARGQVVHGQDCRDMTIIDRSDQVIADLIDRMADLGRIPDWSSLELSGGLAS